MRPPVPTDASTDVWAPAIYDTVVTHSRRERLRRSFTHRVYLWLIDVDAAPPVPAPLRPLARFEAADHLDGDATTLRGRVEDWLRRHDVTPPGGRVLMLANARVLGYTFNPISLFWCHDPDGVARWVIAEVHNTYGERHAYLLEPDPRGRAAVDKNFYVSPFLSITGRYDIRVLPPGPALSVSIGLRQHDQLTLVAGMTGRRRPVTARVLATTWLRRPLMPQLVSTLIRRHGLALWLRRVPIVPRPRAAARRETRR